MSPIIDLGSELLVDRSTIRDPYTRLLATALGETLARGSPWVVLDKRAFYARDSSGHAERRRASAGRSR
jgi:hypothetical protein